MSNELCLMTGDGKVFNSETEMHTALGIYFAYKKLFDAHIQER
jgi:hypothetical protein